MTGTTTHTPGPWTFNDRLVMAPPFGAYSRSHPIAVLRTVGYDGEEEANGALMAAAPDLLAALLNIIDNHDRGDIRSEWLDGTDGEPNFDFAREAIAKARGQQ